MIHIEDDLPVRRLVIDRPEKANALSMAMLHDLAEGIRSAPQAGAAAVVLSGAGSKSFCAGAELSDLAPATRHAQYELLKQVVAAFAESTIPIITLVHGRTLGAGCAFAALSDIVTARDDAILGFPEMRFGMYPALVHAILVEKLPAQLVYQIGLSGRDLDAPAALALGLITEAVSAADFADSAAARVAYYIDRLPAVVIGRDLCRASRGDGLLQRVAAAEAILDSNLEEPTTRKLFDEWMQLMSRRH